MVLLRLGHLRKNEAKGIISGVHTPILILMRYAFGDTEAGRCDGVWARSFRIRTS